MSKISKDFIYLFIGKMGLRFLLLGIFIPEVSAFVSGNINQRTNSVRVMSEAQEARTIEMKSAAVNSTPFSLHELERFVCSLQGALGASPEDNTKVDWVALCEFVSASAHLSHKVLLIVLCEVFVTAAFFIVAARNDDDEVRCESHRGRLLLGSGLGENRSRRGNARFSARQSGRADLRSNV
jgi:hypothetical protein